MLLKRRSRRTLSFRLMVLYAFMYIVSSFIAFLVFYFFITSILNDKINQDMETDVIEFRILYEDGGLEEIEEEMEDEAESDGIENGFFRLFTYDGELIHSSDLEEWEELEINEDAIKAIREGEEFVITNFYLEDKVYEIRSVYGIIDDEIIFNMGITLEEHTIFMNLLRNVFFLLSSIIVILSAIIGLVIAKRALKGVEAVTKAALEISEGAALDRRVNIKTKDLEIKQLANTFNKMLDHIQVLVSEIKEITDNIAHDLKSPLTRIRGNAEITVTSDKSDISDYKKMASNTIEECDGLLEIINTMLYITKADTGKSKLKTEKMDLCEVVYDACDLFTPVLEDKQLNININIPEKCIILGEYQGIQRMVANLLDNAIKYTPKKGTISIAIKTNENNINLIVKDTGMGIPEKDIPLIFKRFYRSGDVSKVSGIGLGLSLVNAIVKKHTGNIQVKSAPNEGSTFIICLPKTVHN